ncbi:MAG: TonB-dependent receptor, partial [Acidobacteriota bacterium]|nr:TonB-dependent receptor [Acidobacteriota bacterium]
RPTNPWSITLEAMSSSSRVFVGDEGNDQIPLDGYQLVNVRTAIAIRDATELFAQIDNLFDANYQTFGILAELEIDLDEAPNATDPRFVAPGNPRSAFAGVRVRF